MVIAFVILIIGLAFILLDRETSLVIREVKRTIGIKGYRSIYSDARGNSKPLHSDIYMISGKPDYIFKRGDDFIPVELKSTVVDMPLEKDIMQLAIYFLLIEENYGIRPQKGRLIYANKAYEIVNNYHIRKRVINIIKEMGNIKNGTIHRYHVDKSGCHTCLYRDICQYT
ncbi:MAG: CRISPR-associated protein Cas4 [Thermoanaerobacteraceae bacterium]|nr:CRISPR-associated protein Cas4 [Thermoanaerobacteraceae bacterium]